MTRVATETFAHCYYTPFGRTGGVQSCSTLVVADRSQESLYPIAQRSPGVLSEQLASL